MSRLCELLPVVRGAGQIPVRRGAGDTSSLEDAVRTTKQFMTYVGGAPFQPAIAHALDDLQVPPLHAVISEERAVGQE